MIRGIKIAPIGQKCRSCWEELTEEDRKGSGGSSYATVDVHSSALGESQTLTMYFCRVCAKSMILAGESNIGISILNDSVEGSLRTLVRLSNDLSPRKSNKG